MFTYNGSRMSTWNIFTGCGVNGEGFCKYCWARKLIETRLKDTTKYKECGFKPAVHLKEFDRKFKSNEWVFISSMGDLAFAPNYVYAHIFETATKYPQTNFLMCTKSPKFYKTHFMPLPNLYFGATIETNRDTSKFSKAPTTEYRYNVMRELHNYKKMLSLEPLMDFDHATLMSWITEINPKIVEVGIDNYHVGLPEPSAEKITNLIKSIKMIGIEVIQKDGLIRILKT